MSKFTAHLGVRDRNTSSRCAKNCWGIRAGENLITRLAEQTAETKQFRSSPWASQFTFETHKHEDLNTFVATFLSLYALDNGVLSSDLIVFQPDSLLSLMEKSSIQVESHWDFIVEAKGRESIRKLLLGALSDWVDFLFVTSLELFAIYADHDGYLTFCSQDEKSLHALHS